MATLPQAELDRIARWMQRDPNLGPCAFTKPQFYAAVAAADAFADSIAASFNAALPAAFRTLATAQQKQMLWDYVTARRSGANPIDGGD